MSEATRARLEFGLALALDVIGAGAVLLVSTRTWQTVTAPRPRPFADVTVDLSGRTVDAAATALAVAALAGVVALLATRRLIRRVVGAALAVVGGVIIWRSIAASSAISAQRARSLASEHHKGIVLPPSALHVSLHAAWAWSSAVAGLCVFAAGALVVVRGHRWHALSARYDAPATASSSQQTDLAMWNAIDRGDDPTS